MSKTVKVKPKKGLKVFDPATKLHLTDEGKEVPYSMYWRRMINCGDVEVVRPEKKATKKASKPKKSEVSEESQESKDEE